MLTRGMVEQALDSIGQTLDLGRFEPAPGRLAIADSGD